MRLTAARAGIEPFPPMRRGVEIKQSTPVLETFLKIMSKDLFRPTIILGDSMARCSNRGPVFRTKHRFMTLAPANQQLALGAASGSASVEQERSFGVPRASAQRRSATAL